MPNSRRRLEDYVGQPAGVLTRGSTAAQEVNLRQGLLTKDRQALMPALNVEPATPVFPTAIKARADAFERFDAPRTPCTTGSFPAVPSWSAYPTPEKQKDEVYPLAAFEIKTSSPTTQVTQTHSATSSPISREISPLHRKASPLRKKPEQEEGFVKRPLNSFMLYRKDHQHQFATNNHQSISRAIGDMWRKETAETKNYYDKLAKAERDRHHLEHPGYKFQPKKKKDSKAPAAAPKMPKKKRSTELIEEARSENHSTTADAGSSESLSVPGTYDMIRSTSQHSFQGTPLSFASSCDSFPFFVDRRGSPALPLEYGHYAGHLDYSTREQAQEPGPVPSQPSGYYRDPQDWHRQDARPTMQGNSYSGTPTIPNEWPAYEAQHGTHDRTAQFRTADVPVLLPPTFAEMDEREYQQRLQMNCWNADMNNRSNLAPSPYQYQNQNWQDTQPQALTAAEEQDLQALDYAYALSTGFAPGAAQGSWELERNSI